MQISRRVTSNIDSYGRLLVYFPTTPIKVVYEYLGSTCSLRRVEVTALARPTLREVSIQKIKPSVEAQGNEFRRQEVLEQLTEIETGLSKLKETLSVPVGKKTTWNYQKSPWFNQVQSATRPLNNGIGWTADANRALRSGPSMSLLSVDGCASFEMPTLIGELGKISSRGFMFPSAPIPLTMTKSSCVLTIGLFYEGDLSALENFSGNGTNSLAPFSGEIRYLKLGSLTLTATSPVPTKTSITCIKGKVKKVVTAINPKCPTGYLRAG